MSGTVLVQRGARFLHPQINRVSGIQRTSGDIVGFVLSAGNFSDYNNVFSLLLS